MHRNVAEATVEDPLEALLDLAESARKHLRPLSFVTAYGLLGGLIAAAVLLPIGIVALLRGGDLVYVLALTAGVLSIVAVVMAIRIDRFLSDFDRRLRAIEGFVRFNPRPSIPGGREAAERALAWLERTDERFRTVLSGARDRLARNVRFPGAKFPPLSAYLLRKSMYLPRQYPPLLQVPSKRVDVADPQLLKDLAQHVDATTGVPPDRVLVVQTVPADIPEEIERWLDANWVLHRRGSGRGGEVRACPLQLLVEREDGKYEVAPAFAG